MSSKLKELGISSCIADSSGNAGSSIAAYATKAGVLCKIFCPESTSEGKLVQIIAYGAELVKVPGNRSDTAAAVQREAETYYYASQNWNPFYLEGIKTLAFEICEQMGWRVPDAILCPVGYGGIYMGLYHGFRWLVETGIANHYPRLIGIQAETVSPVYQAFYRNADDVEEVPPGKTMAEGVACTKPVRGKKLLEIARETNGSFETVSEKDIIEGWRELNQQGLYVEPTSSVVIKALDRLVSKNRITRTDSIVLILTGTGLKATEKLAKYVCL
jgi:threonine synthase